MMPPQAGPGRSALRLRVVSAAILVPPVLAAVWFGPPYLSALAAAAGLGMAWEWGRLTGGGGFGARQGLVIVTVVAAIVLAADRRFLWGCGIAVLGMVAAALAAPRARSWTALGTLWIALGAIAFLWLAGPPMGGRATLFWLLGVVWASDIFAYLVGRMVGGRRLAPRWSPNKTWAGAGGGVVGAAAIGAIAAAAGAARPGLAVPASIALGLASQAGDLAESVAKRHFSVKDTSRLIPGHGGVLDRLDGLLAAAVLAALLTLIFGTGILGMG
ncbi:MAG: phosphatidate cytidylyltransferase [Stellaceae bacterium]